MSPSGTGNGEKGAQHKVHRGHRECEVSDVIFAMSGNGACVGMCDGFAGDLHDSRITCVQPGPLGILGFPNYGGVGNETLVGTARNKDREDH